MNMPKSKFMTWYGSIALSILVDAVERLERAAAQEVEGHGIDFGAGAAAPLSSTHLCLKSGRARRRARVRVDSSAIASIDLHASRDS